MQYCTWMFAVQCIERGATAEGFICRAGGPVDQGEGRAGPAAFLWVPGNLQELVALVKKEGSYKRGEMTIATVTVVRRWQGLQGWH